MWQLLDAVSQLYVALLVNEFNNDSENNKWKYNTR
jgi:hypothetical protein